MKQQTPAYGRGSVLLGCPGLLLLVSRYGFTFVHRFDPMRVLGFSTADDILINLAQLSCDGAHLANPNITKIHSGYRSDLGRCSSQE